MVGDTEVNRTLPRVLLERHDCKVVECASGAEALRLASTDDFDCIMLDVMMPGVSGIEVCQQLRSDPTLAKLQIIACTATPCRWRPARS